MFADLLELPRIDIIAEPELEEKSVEEPATILLIDDDEVHTDVLSRRLENQGFETLVAESAESGFDKAKFERPSLILLDIRLPDADGLDVCERLADAPETCTIPVIILSGMDKPNLLRRCRSAGCQFFVRKPYDPNALLLLIRQAIHDSLEFKI